MDGPLSLAMHFSGIEDPRVDRSKLHQLADILLIAICAVVGGADSFEAIEIFAEAHEQWFRRFLTLSNGVPSHDTFARVFARISPREFERRFSEWTKTLATTFSNEIIAIDGQTLRRSHDHNSAKAAIHMVSAWAVNAGLVLAQTKVDDKSNEISAIPEVLKLLDLRGCIVTMDAMGCQQKIAQQIIDQGGDYLIGLKGNQGTTYEAVKNHFQLIAATRRPTHEETDKGHGRIEIRTYTADNAKTVLDLKAWPGIESVIRVRSMRQVKDKTSEETRYFISSLLPNDLEKICSATRSHWGVENGLHYVLDETFEQDRSRIRKDNAPENFAVVRHIATNLLKQAPPAKKHSPSMNLKRIKASMDTKYLQRIITGSH